MTTNRATLGLAGLVSILSLSACGPKQDPKAQQRLQQEAQAEQDEAKANQAITNMNQKMFSHLNAQPIRAAAPTTPTQPNPPKP